MSQFQRSSLEETEPAPSPPPSLLIPPPPPPPPPPQQESEPIELQDQDAKDDSLFWDQYVKEAELYDKELVRGLGGDLDSLLIFAGLFSAVNTAFIIESYQDLKPDPAESGGTNALLRTLIQTLDNSTTAVTLPTDFTPSQRIVIVNALFFASLFCSLFSAFGAVLAKQWLNEYERAGDNRVPHARARQRHAKYLGMRRYRCEMVMQALGTVLQISLLLFFVALTNWLWGINHAIAIVAIIALGVTFAFYFATTAMSIIDSASPFSTRFSALLRELWSSRATLDSTPPTQMDSMDGECIAWVRNNATMFESIAGMARSAAYVPDEIRARVGLSHADVGVSLLRSIISSNALPLGLNNGTLFSTITTIRYAMTSWKDVPILLACDVIAQLHEMLRLAVPKDPVMSDSIALILERFDVDVPSRLVARTQRPTQAMLIDLIQVPPLTIEGRRAALSILWRYYLREIYGGHREFSSAEVEGPFEESWQWKVADALASTAVIGHQDDSDLERLEFRVAWVAIFGPDVRVSRLLLYGQDAARSPLWKQFFAHHTFQDYLSNQFRRYPRRRDYILRKVAMDLLASRASHTALSPHRVWSGDIDDDEGSRLRLAFDVAHVFQPEYMAALYWWYYFDTNRRYLNHTMPTTYTSKRYLRLAIFPFLAEHLKSDPWMPEKLVPRTVAAIQAYVAQVDAVDSSMRGHYSQTDTQPLVVMSDLIKKIRDGSYRYRGRESIGRELWNCFKMVVRLLHPGEGVVKFNNLLATQDGRMDDLENYNPLLYAYLGHEELTVDWDEVEAVEILGSDLDALPAITKENFLCFDSYDNP